MNAPHTPGPWHVYDSRFREVNGAIMDAAGNKVASAHGPTTEELEANARLIAAAPELLEALRRATALLAGGPTRDFCRAAIAKAEAVG